MNLVELLQIKYPNANNPNDYQIAIDTEGNQYISLWELGEPQPTIEQLDQWSNDTILNVQSIMNKYSPLIDNYISNQAKTRNYDSAISVATYLNSTNPQWAKEAKNFITWRDQVWQQSINLEQQMLADITKEPKSFDDFIASLPILNWDA